MSSLGKVKVLETETIVNKTLIKETETHVFKITNYNPTSTTVCRYRGTVTDKETENYCGDFTVTTGIHNALSLNVNLDCKHIISDILTMIEDIKNGNIE